MNSIFFCIQKFDTTYIFLIITANYFILGRNVLLLCAKVISFVSSIGIDLKVVASIDDEFSL